MTDNPLITVVVPCYNGERFVDRCLTSIARQTYSPLEVLLIDDGSTDQSVAKAANYPHVTVVSNGQNRGLSYSRNHGIELARGKYIHFVDVDDEVNSRFYESIVRYAELSGADVTACGYIFQRVPEKSQLFTRHRIYTGVHDKLRATYVCKNGYSVRYLIRRSLLERHPDLRFPVGRLAEDAPFSVRAIYYANKLATAPGAEYLYRYEPDSITETPDPERRRVFAEGLAQSQAEVQSFLASHGITRMPGRNSDMVNYFLSKVSRRIRGLQTDLTERL